MAEPRQARVINSGPLLALQLEGQPEVVLKGGKYIIINTGRTNEEGKLIKRAYSLFAVKPEQKQFFLAAEAVTDGIASRYLRELQCDDMITFSGPWGRFHWPLDGATETSVIAAAFGSGITGVLGYLPSIPEHVNVHLYWFQDTASILVDESMVRECAQQPRLILHKRSMADDPLLDQAAWPLDGRYVAAGEGSRVERFLSYFRQHGVPEERLQSEIFYRATQDATHAKGGG
jgi:ferredoxin-NADP reductase